MHSRIFQVSMEPIKETDYICEADYYDHWFTNKIGKSRKENNLWDKD